MKKSVSSHKLFKDSLNTLKQKQSLQATIQFPQMNKVLAMPSIQVIYPLKQDWRKNLNIIPNALPPCKTIKRLKNLKYDTLVRTNTANSPIQKS
jgi:hypothetical protein